MNYVYMGNTLLSALIFGYIKKLILSVDREVDEVLMVTGCTAPA